MKAIELNSVVDKILRVTIYRQLIIPNNSKIRLIIKLISNLIRLILSLIKLIPSLIRLIPSLIIGIISNSIAQRKLSAVISITTLTKNQFIHSEPHLMLTLHRPELKKKIRSVWQIFVRGFAPRQKNREIPGKGSSLDFFITDKCFSCLRLFYIFRNRTILQNFSARSSYVAT